MLIIISTSLLKRCYAVDITVKKKLPVVISVKEVGIVRSK